MENIAKAIVALQSELKPVDKSATNPFYKSNYAPLPEVMENIQPLLAKHKLAVVQLMDNLQGDPALKTIILHESGEKLEGITPLLLVKEDPQSHGSAVTYARRYGIMSALGLVADEDDDGNKATTAHQTYKPTPASATKPASDKQLYLLEKLAKERGYDNAWITETLSKVHTSQDASMIIDRLNNMIDEK